jgi:ribosome-associated protein
VPIVRKTPRSKSPPKRPAAPTPLLESLETALADGRAEEVTRIDLAGKSAFADHMLIASGRSARQVAALADRVMTALGERGKKRAPVEGLKHGDWVLIDAGDIIVHIFRPEIRARYNLEKMWGVDFHEVPGEDA